MIIVHHIDFFDIFLCATEHMLAPGLAHMSDLQIHTGNYFAQQVKKWGAQEEEIHVIYNGVDIEKFNPGIKKDRLDHSYPLLLSARRLVRKNGLDRLLLAMPYILMKHSPINEDLYKGL